MDNISLEMTLHQLFEDAVGFKIEVGVYECNVERACGTSVWICSIFAAE